MNKSLNRISKIPRLVLPPIIPLFAVCIGLYLLKSAWISILLYHAGIVTCVFILGPTGRLLKLLSGWRLSTGLGMILICAFTGIIVTLLWRYMVVDNTELGTSLMRYDLQDLSWSVFMVYFVVVHPILEEIFWRDFLLRTNGSTSSWWYDIAFGIYHFFVLILFIKIIWAIAVFLILVMVSRIWKEIAVKNNGLLIPVVSHIAADLSVIAGCLYIINQGNGFI